jgi:hypothetical protein
VQGDGQAVRHRRLEQRPVEALADRMRRSGEQQHLHEALVGGAAFDLGHRHVDIFERHHDRGAEARVTIEEFRADPVIEGAGIGRGKVVAVERLHAIEAVENADVAAERIERLGADDCGGGGRPPLLRAPVGTHRERRHVRVVDAVQVVDATDFAHFPPMRRQMRKQRARIGHKGVDIAVDAHGGGRVD